MSKTISRIPVDLAARIEAWPTDLTTERPPFAILLSGARLTDLGVERLLGFRDAYVRGDDLTGQIVVFEVEHDENQPFRLEIGPIIPSTAKVGAADRPAVDHATEIARLAAEIESADLCEVGTPAHRTLWVQGLRRIAEDLGRARERAAPPEQLRILELPPASNLERIAAALPPLGQGMPPSLVKTIVSRIELHRFNMNYPIDVTLERIAAFAADVMTINRAGVQAEVEARLSDYGLLDFFAVPRDGDDGD